MHIIYGERSPFSRLIQLADLYAHAEWPVLMSGETGVGKELMARRIHEKSRRQPFIPVNCTAIPKSLFESEFFGYERGSFSGAVQSYRGLVRSANGGTLFLDELGELDIELQAKLLRLLDSGEVRAVGSTRIEHVNVRFIAASNVDLYQAAQKGKFRFDLLERLSVLTLQLIPLRERKEDILPIASSILERNECRFSDDVFSPLLNYDWPGNIRQLKNILTRASVLGQKTVTGELIGKIISEEAIKIWGVEKGGLNLADTEKHAIFEALRYCQGNKKRAAERLGIAKSTLHEKLRRYQTESIRTSVDDSFLQESGGLN